METWLAGELMTVLGKWEGLTMRGPSMRPERSNCEMLCRLPKVVPTAMPISRVVASLISSLLSSMASLAAEQTSLVLRSRSRSPFFPISARGSNSASSPACCTRKGVVSKSVMGRVPEAPRASPSQNASLPVPIEESTPMPVMTILRSISSLHAQPAVHLDHLARDIPGSVAQQEQHGRRHVLRRAEPPEGDHLQSFLPELFPELRRHIRTDESGRDRVHPDIIGRHLFRQRLGKADHTGLRGGIVHLASHGADPADRGDVH